MGLHCHTSLSQSINQYTIELIPFLPHVAREKKSVGMPVLKRKLVKKKVRMLLNF